MVLFLRVVNSEAVLRSLEVKVYVLQLLQTFATYCVDITDNCG